MLPFLLYILSDVRIFNRKSAERDFDRYKRKDPNKTTRSLLKALYRQGVAGKTLLDIGGGVGVIQQELLQRGVVSSTDVDASSAYINKAKELMQLNHREEQMRFIHADFVDVANTISNHDIVTLEKVVCCYPDVDHLLKEASLRSKQLIGLVYPMDNWFSRFLIQLTHIYFRLKKNPFRTFVHSEKYILTLLKEQGFEPVYTDRMNIWRVSLFKRVV